MDQVSRRQCLKRTATTFAARSIGDSKAIPATSVVKTISHGKFSITVLSDGHLTVHTRLLARIASAADINLPLL
jgi:hypothetical protein